VQKVTLSTVIAEALYEGLRVHAARRRSEEVLNGYKKAFSGLSKKEIAILDGVILEPTARHWSMVYPRATCE
jgi:FixJ family two-component response regulator